MMATADEATRRELPEPPLAPGNDLSPSATVGLSVVNSKSGWGAAVGPPVGTVVGMFDGNELGDELGAALGAALGMPVGAADGVAVGTMDGGDVGPPVGAIDFATVGEVVGPSVGAIVGGSVASALHPDSKAPTHNGVKSLYCWRVWKTDANSQYW